MFPKFSFLLIFAVTLNLTHKSLCQDWETFQKKHLTDSLSVDCDNVMRRALFHCKARNTFIYSLAGQVKALCRGVPGTKDVLSHKVFTLIDCIKKEYCQYKTKISDNVICITCENELPVHFVNVGSCNNPV
ncbi:protein P-30-like [Lithobates pipiens]